MRCQWKMLPIDMNAKSLLEIHADAYLPNDAALTVRRQY
jgi:hypothetical protein